MSERLGYDHVVKLFSPGYAVHEASHPILKNLQNPYFNRILNQTDQVVFILNHTTFRYEYVSENAEDFTGYAPSEFLEGGLEFGMKLMHPGDVHILNTTAYPSFFEALNTVSVEQRTQLLFAHTFRLIRKDGSCIHVLQKSIPITYEGEKVLLGLMVISDITQFKRDNTVLYRNTIQVPGEQPIVISQGETKSTLFTDRELGILELSATGLAEKEIADRLSLSVFTIKTHKKKMFAKAGVKNTAALINFATANLII